MTSKTIRTANLAASAMAPSFHKPVAASHSKAAASKATKGAAASVRKAEAAKTKKILTTAQKLKAALDVSAEEAGPTASVKSAIKTESASTAGSSKSATVIAMLRLAEGTTLEAIQQATGWQAHSVRGFLSGTVRKKQGMSLISEKGENGIRRYRIDNAAVAA